MEIKDYLGALVERSSTIYERLGPDFTRIESAESAPLIQNRLLAWQDMAASGDLPRFERRLALSGLDLHTAQYGLMPVRRREGLPLPTWTAILADVLSLASEAKIQKRTYPAPAAFEDILCAFVQIAQEAVTTRSRQHLALLSDDAYKALEYQLLHTLATYSVNCFGTEFQRFKDSLQADSNTDSKIYYAMFVGYLLQGELKDLFYKYSALARLLATATEEWIESTCEFLTRLANDWRSLQEAFAQSFSQVTSLNPGLSDRHNGGRTVFALTFDTGFQVIYKPKSMGLEYEYNQFLLQINRWGFTQPMRGLMVLQREGYGWVEFAAPQPCQSDAEVKAYFQRAGGLICLMYVLAGQDIHNENVIAMGPQPVIIDLEALLSPEYLSFYSEDPHLINRAFHYSVLNSGLLTSWLRMPDGHSSDIAGIGLPAQITYKISRWQYINTDGMAYLPRVEHETRAGHVVFLGDQPQSPFDHLSELIDGFQEMYSLILEHRADLLSEWLPRLSAHEGRVVIRNTQLYQILLHQRSLDPNTLQTGVERSLILESLYRGLLAIDENMPLLPGVYGEITALLRGDVPLLTTSPTSTDLRIEQIVLEKGSAYSGVDQVKRILDQMSEADCQQQSQFIKWSLYTRLGQQYSPTTVMETSHVEQPVVPQVLLDHAVRLAQSLKDSVVEDNGTAQWLQMSFLPGLDRYEFAPMHNGVYNGSIGIALFLAAMAQVTGDADYRSLAYAAVCSVQKDLRDRRNSQLLVNEQGIGGLTGFGSLVYGMVWLSKFLQDTAFIEDARLAAGWIDDVTIARDHQFDLIGGSAGAIMGLLALHAISLDPDVLGRARQCGDYLIANRTANHAWITIQECELPGFLHGAAGIAYALLHLYAATGDIRYQTAAQDAIDYEATLFSPEHRTWRDVRPSMQDTPYETCAICHGAAGIAGARAATLQWLDNERIRQDIAESSYTIQHSKRSPFDYLCCGNMGRVESLLVASTHLDDAPLAQAAQGYAASIIARAEANGQFMLSPWIPGQMETKDFFRGISGIGYQMLRLADPDAMPSLVFMELPRRSV